MWRAGSGAKFLAREKHFDFVIEPRDLAEAFDAGLTRAAARAGEAGRRRSACSTTTSGCRATRPARELGLDPDRPAVLVQLGSRNNFDYGGLHRLLLDRLTATPGLQVVTAEWLMSERSPDPAPGVCALRHFPISR